MWHNLITLDEMIEKKRGNAYLAKYFEKSK
jgi:hypothetical protein